MAVIEEIKTNEAKNEGAEVSSYSETDNETPTLVNEGDTKAERADQAVSDDNDHDGEEQGDTGVVAGSGRTKIGKNEKKARGALSKCAMKLVPDVTCVKLRRNKLTSFVISKPEVYKCDNSDTYIVFGHVKVEDLSAQSKSEAANKLTQKMAALSAKSGALAGVDGGKAGAPEEYKIEEEDDGEEVDASQFNEGDIDVVMKQTTCTRKKAIQALKKYNNDIIEAIMSLT